MQGFIHSIIRILLNLILVIAIIQVLGIPMASVLTVLASAGLAIGLSLQGALSNCAGGIMILVFKPFKVGDYIVASGAEGVVKDITVFYTHILTLDNKRITVPNGSLMSANITDYSAESTRRVDLTFACAKSEKPAEIQQLILDTISANALVLKDPAPMARVSGGSNEAMEFVARAWCKNADYWTVYFDLTQAVTEAFGQKGVQTPAVRVIK